MFSSKMFSMLKIVFQLCFVIFLVLGDFVFADDSYVFNMLKKCKNFEEETMQGVAFFSSTEFWQFQITTWQRPIIPGTSDRYFFRSKFLGRNATSKKPFEHLFATCHCSNTTENYFFFPTSLKVDGNVSNGIALCVRSHTRKCLLIDYFDNKDPCEGVIQYYNHIPGIKDSKDLYDLMAYKYSTVLPRNIMSSSDTSDNSSKGCFDIYGNPTRSFDGIQSCLVQYLYNRVNGSDYVYKYSGPLLYGNLDWIPDDFLDNIATAVHYEVKELNHGYCKFHQNGTLYSFTCVCHGNGKNQERCQQHLHKRICAYDMPRPSASATNKMNNLWFNENCGYFFISHSTTEIDVSIGGDSFNSKYAELYRQECHQYSAEEWCSKVGERTSFYETYKDCCNDRDFCNIINVTYYKNDIDNMKKNILNCTYSAKGQAAFFAYCELYYDLMSKNMVVLNPFVSKVYQEFATTTESCFYVIANITVTDNINCTTRLYNETDTLHFFYRCRCTTSNCDDDDEEMALQMYNTVNTEFHDGFHCESLKYSSKSDYKKFESHVLESFGKETGAICFIEIFLIDDVYSIKAEAIKDNFTLAAKRICSQFRLSPHSSNETLTEKLYASCCTVIMKNPQSNSSCTIEIMLNKFENQIKNVNIQKQLTGQKGTLKCAKNDCLISDGCFETRELAVVQKKEEEDVVQEVVEEWITSSSLECVNKIEEKVISEAPILNPDYGYVCKLMEAKDRCTVVHPQDPNSKPLIVCCCNEGYTTLSDTDGTLKCPSKVGKLPSEIGKRIGSFH